jgi:hypothetical protein
MDNHYGKGINGQFWMNADCSLHGKQKEEENDDPTT